MCWVKNVLIYIAFLPFPEPLVERRYKFSFNLFKQISISADKKLATLLCAHPLIDTLCCNKENSVNNKNNIQMP